MKIPQQQTASVEPVPAARTESVEAMPAVDMYRAWAAMTGLRSPGLPTAQSAVSPDLALTLDIPGEAVQSAGAVAAKREFPFSDLSLRAYWDHCVGQVDRRWSGVAEWFADSEGSRR